VKAFAFIFLFLFTFSVQASFSESPVWYEGSLVLKTNQVLKGQLSVQSTHDLILFKSDNKLMVYTADKINSFFFYDGASNINRKYISLEEKINAFTSNHLYEIVLNGEVKVVRKLIFPFSDPSDDGNSYNYFVLSDNELMTLNKFRTKVYPALLTRSETLSRFMEDNKLNPNHRADIIKIVDYYNKTIRTKPPLPLRLSQNKSVISAASIL
jgi:hypothetical protein